MATGDFGKATVEIVPELNQQKWQSMLELLGMRTITTVMREFDDAGYCLKEVTTVEHQRIEA